MKLDYYLHALRRKIVHDSWSDNWYIKKYKVILKKILNLVIVDQ